METSHALPLRDLGPSRRKGVGQEREEMGPQEEHGAGGEPRRGCDKPLWAEHRPCHPEALSLILLPVFPAPDPLRQHCHCPGIRETLLLCAAYWFFPPAFEPSRPRSQKIIPRDSKQLFRSKL